ncbi:MAG: lysostaphin resistance A-like protein [Planctomycetota bacterium]
MNESVRRVKAWLKRDVLRPVSTSPAAWCFATIWAVAAIYLVAIGRADVVLWSLLLLVVLAFLCVITVGITRQEHEPRAKLSRTGRTLLILQIAVIVFFICITLYTSLMFRGIVEHHPIPVWSGVIQAFIRLGERVFSNDLVANPGLAMANLARYFLLPLPILLFLGARLRELGLCRGHRTLSVVILWCFVPGGVLVYLVEFGGLSCMVLARRLLSHLLINGFSEEFLVRGALQTRFRALLGTQWAIVIQALTFGIWHFAANYGSLGITGVAAVTAFCIVRSATFGLAYGIIFQRTRSLWACSAIHVVTNSLAG